MKNGRLFVLPAAQGLDADALLLLGLKALVGQLRSKVGVVVHQFSMMALLRRSVAHTWERSVDRRCRSFGIRPPACIKSCR